MSDGERWAVGVDGARASWVAVVLDAGRVADCVVLPTLAEIVAAYPRAGAFGIDVPIGYAEPSSEKHADVESPQARSMSGTGPGRGLRGADQAARDFVGPRRSSVFSVPPRAVMHAASYSEANALSRKLCGRGLSKQSYMLREKILEAEALAEVPRVFEVHPEVSFRAMKGAPLGASKKTWNGMRERLALLEAQGIRLPDSVADSRVAADDVTDAAAAAWSAWRVLRGDAAALPETPEDPFSAARMPLIWY